MSEKIRKRSWFYTAKPVWKRVNKKEFNQFISSYPRRLDIDVTGICDPPLKTYNDFVLANRFPYSIVAKTYLYDDNPDDYFYAPEEKRIYDIVSNFEEVFASKTGKMVDNEDIDDEEEMDDDELIVPPIYNPDGSLTDYGRFCKGERMR